MFTFIMILHLILCFFLIVVVLLQTGKGADMGAAFGGASQTVFGATGAMTLLHKVTTVTAVLFMLTSMSLAWLSSRPDTVLADEIEKAKAEAAEKAEADKVAEEAKEADPPKEGGGAGSARSVQVGTRHIQAPRGGRRKTMENAAAMTVMTTISTLDSSASIDGWWTPRDERR